MLIRTPSRLVEALGSGERISLARLAVNHLQRNARPLRVAIDISIWLFQVQAGRGGANPELRTFFFRLVRLVGLPIHPLFIYDGPQRPSYKRGKVIGGRRGQPNSGPTATIRRSKELLELFRFPYHTAPGEAEAECARLQTTGVVDAAISDDIDTVMFGSKFTITNFSKESASGTKVATHATVFRTEKVDDDLEPNVNFDRAGMILFALLSGGDYHPAGIPKCGRKLAAEISQAGFGSDLLRAVNSVDSDRSLGEWRLNLQNELHDNTQGFFSCKHRAIHIPRAFPDKKILSLYSNPTVSSEAQLRELQRSLEWDRPMDLPGLRTFAEQEFGWKTLNGAKKFIRILAAPLVSYKLRLSLPLSSTTNAHDAEQSSCLYSKRTHYTTDGLPELRLEIIPANIVGLDLDAEVESPSQKQDRDEDAEVVSMETDILDQSTATSRPGASYDPKSPERVWVLEAIAEIGIPDAVRRWKAQQQSSNKAASLKKRRQKRGEPKVIDPGMKPGALRSYFPVVNKPGMGIQPAVISQTRKPSFRDPFLGTGPSHEASVIPCNQDALLAHQSDLQASSQFTNGSNGDRQTSNVVDLDFEDEGKYTNRFLP